MVRARWRLRYLFPYARLTIRTRLSPPEVAQRVGADAAWHVRVTQTGFEISRKIDYRNSFLPLVIARVRDAPHGADVRVVIRMHAVVCVFMAVWIGAALRGAILDGGVTWIFPVFGIGLLWGGFVPEAHRAERMLRRALPPPPEPPPRLGPFR